MKLWKVIIPLVAVIGISGGVYIGVSKSAEKKAEEETISFGAGEFLSFDASSIKEFSLSVDGETYELQSQNGTDWNFTDNNNKVNYSNIIYAIDTLSTLNTTKRIEENTQDLTKYGLDNPITISCSDGSNTYQLQIGNPSPTGESYYIKSVDNNDVYTISSDDGIMLHLGKDDLKYRYITDSYVSAVNKIVYKKGTETIFHCEKQDNNTWQLIEPITNLSINLAKISNIADLLIRADVVDFITENPTQEELKQYGLDNPLYTIELADDDEDRTVYFGNSPEDNIIYAQFQDTKEVVTFYIGELGIIDSGIEVILDNAIYSDNKREISNVSISYNGTDTSIGLSYDENDRKYRYYQNGSDVTDTEVGSKLSSIVDASLNIPLYKVDFSAEPIGEPTFTITYTRTTEPNTVTLKFIPTDEEAKYYYVLLNDTYQGSIVRDRYLKSENSLLYLIENQ
ncbi:MAG: DUF4340 domain-containing protein [Oscillospiraceae bacterium]